MPDGALHSWGREIEPQEKNSVELAQETDRHGLRIPRVTFGNSENDEKLYRHALRSMRDTLQAAGGTDVWEQDGTAHLMGGCRMGTEPSNSVTNADGRTWEIPNVWICDGSLFPTGGGVNPSATIQALACRIGDRIATMGKRSEL